MLDLRGLPVDGLDGEDLTNGVRRAAVDDAEVAATSSALASSPASKPSSLPTAPPTTPMATITAPMLTNKTELSPMQYKGNIINSPSECYFPQFDVFVLNSVIWQSSVN